ncbi:hypothetical protein [Nocardiopsis alborubida]|uniref:Lipoprotein n=1 Tax=Nocardiopsis alborubida TaxID=146802 RepID=A0A7X6MIS0_9ACTN|nr:hypothetical protein [Nocardiopsis alborubida]NKZ02097.1 hypothetical protein [Nocardiopsis alborubida]
MRFRPLVFVALVLGLTACSQTPTAPAGPTQAPVTEAAPGDEGRIPLRVEAITDSGSLMDSHEDGTCEWIAPSYVLRDGAGTVVDVGDLVADGNGGGTVGQVRGEMSDRVCVLSATLSAPPADVYDVEIVARTTTQPGAGEEYSGSALISRTTAVDEAVVVTVDGPPAMY